MQIRLQTLDHQQHALTALTHVFHSVEMDLGSILEANPVFDASDPQIIHNIHQLQNGAVEGIDPIPRPWRQKSADNAHILGVDVKMETGTGKTLVYTQFMYELNKLYGFTKFYYLGTPRLLSGRVRNLSLPQIMPTNILTIFTGVGSIFV